jgi:nickel/cobalt transporter (NiCoT) family protein
LGDPVATTTADPSTPTARGRKGQALTGREWARLGGMAGFIVLLHVVGFGILALLVVPGHYRTAGGVFGFGTGLTAYTLGLRHAFDADHIAAIDNTTRKLMEDGSRPLSVGFWFSLGHSSVVFGLTLLLAVGVREVGTGLTDDDSEMHRIGGLIGTLVSGAFLLLIAVINLVILVALARVFRAMRSGGYDEDALEEQLANRGLLNRILGRVTRAVRKPWQMYPLGILFGLGFDTVTEISLLVLAAGSVASGLPWYAILCLPVLFAAGMSLLDTIDGSFMNFAYGWAFSKPVRKVYYNLVITGLSVAVALIIGGIELLGILVEKLSLTGPFWDSVASVDLNTVGFWIVGLFAATWIVALAVWRVGRIEERWDRGLRSAEKPVG